MPRTAASWVARRLPVADDDHRDELAESVGQRGRRPLGL
jgi:hypothetical protein